MPLKYRIIRKRPAPQPLHQQQYMQPAPHNQVYSRSRTAVSSPMYAQSGAGQVGIGPNSPLGSRLGWYAEIVQAAHCAAVDDKRAGRAHAARAGCGQFCYHARRNHPECPGCPAERQPEHRLDSAKGRVSGKPVARTSTPNYRQLHLGAIYFQSTLMQLRRLHTGCRADPWRHKLACCEAADSRQDRKESR